jgi:hypothetical protein
MNRGKTSVYNSINKNVEKEKRGDWIMAAQEASLRVTSSILELTERLEVLEEQLKIILEILEERK